MEALIVSNDERTISYLSAELNAKQIDVLIAASNETALDLVKMRKPWVVFADILGKGIDAVSLLRALEKDRPEISVVGISRRYDAEEAISLLRRGIRDYLAMPLQGQQKLIHKAIHRAVIRARGIVSYMSEHDLLAQQKASISKELLQLQEDQEAGRFVQLKLFPKNPLQLSSFEFSHRIFPSLYLSGDFIDYYPLDENRSFFYFADVSGHGASSAFITMMLKTVSHRWVIDMKKQKVEISPASFINHINKEMMKVQLGKHMTLFCGVLDDQKNTLCYSVAAHYPKPRVRNGGQMFSLEESALPVGVFKDAEFKDYQLEVKEDFAMFLFSDGVMEVLEQEDLAAKEQMLYECIDKSNADISYICDDFNLDDTNALPDDISILLIKRL